LPGRSALAAIGNSIASSSADNICHRVCECERGWECIDSWVIVIGLSIDDYVRTYVCPRHDDSQHRV
jgi:hypothetical protein